MAQSRSVGHRVRGRGLPRRADPRRICPRDPAKVGSTAGAVLSEAATLLGACPSTAVSQKPCQVAGANSPRISSAAQRNKRRLGIGLEHAGRRDRPAGLSSQQFCMLLPIAAGRDALPAGEEVDQQVAGDLREPGAKAAPLRVPPVDGSRHGPEDLLTDVLRVRVLQALAVSEAIYQRLVQGHELAPFGRIGRIAQFDDQRVSRAGQIIHLNSSPQVKHRRGKYLTGERKADGGPAWRWGRLVQKVGCCVGLVREYDGSFSLRLGRVTSFLLQVGSGCSCGLRICICPAGRQFLNPLIWL